MKTALKNIYLIIAGIFAFLIINTALFYTYPNKFPAVAYVMFLVIPLVVAVVVVFARFSFIFTSRISEQEDEKKILRERQKDIVENMIEGLVVHNKSGKILSVNNMAEKFIGIPSSEMLYKTKAEIKSKSLLLDALFNGFDSTNIKEYSFKDEYGEEYVYKIINVVLNKKRGETLKIIRNISREKRLDRMKSEYLTTMSHKFLTPLNEIKWTAPNLLDTDVKSDDKKRFVDNIIGSTDRLIDLTSLLLRVTEMEDGNFGYKLGPTDVQSIVENSIRERQDDAEAKKVPVKFNAPDSPLPNIICDKDRLKVVVDNFIDNAIKYTHSGGEVKVSLTKEGNNIKVSVEDSGIGISKEAQVDIFKKFIRDKRAVSVHTEGSGLGLFIAKNIIDELKGNIGFTSSENGGSTFFFTLPIKSK